MDRNDRQRKRGKYEYGRDKTEQFQPTGCGGHQCRKDGKHPRADSDAQEPQGAGGEQQEHHIGQARQSALK